jgi:uncharacterized protein (TIGR04255 family)
MINKLPKPPLTEVVFEMRWALGAQPPLQFDPGYPQLFDTFTAYAKRKKFTEIKDFQPAYSPSHFGVSRRYHKPGTNFPLLQIGPGIFAANDGPDYEWAKFRPMALDAASAIVADYSAPKEFPFKLAHIELRYLDTFDESVIGTADLPTFIREATTAQLSIPNLAEGIDANKPTQGRIVLQSQVKTPAHALFIVDFASAKQDETPVVRLETKVISQGEHLLFGKSGKDLEAKLSQWLKEAHDVTSAAFKKLVSEQVYDKFKRT